ncbi:MAG: ATP-binding protein [Edaphobacter sp.]
MHEKRGVRTRMMLIAPLVLVIASVTAASLLIVRDRMRQQFSNNLAADLAHSVETFQNFEGQRRSALQRENALLADLPSLKALMTTSDQRTIEDGAVEFWKVSGNDLFALATSHDHVVAAYTVGAPATPKLRNDLEVLIANPAKHYLLSDGRLFEYSVRPLYFGREVDGTLLGYVISGYAIDRDFVRQVSQASDAEATFLANGKIVASTLTPSRQGDLLNARSLLAEWGTRLATVSLGGEHYLFTGENLSSGAEGQLHLIVLKSFGQAERAMSEINRLVSIVGLLALIVGSVLMLVLSGMVTRPLELLAKSVRAFGTGDGGYSLPTNGTQEVRELSIAFARMRKQIQETNRALLESERLATIGRMASSVSHDLRHYLAAVYANAEFLASSRLTEEERNELFIDIRAAVHGTTELIDSLLIFSRTGTAVQREPELVSALLERAIALVRAHPDAERVVLRAQYGEAKDTVAVLDARQMERAIYNLLLNACQSTRKDSNGLGTCLVVAEITATSKDLMVTITDNGPGVAEAVRNNLFEPFVSEGKQSGTGLGLTLAHCIAQEHGGFVRLVSSRPGKTVFLLSIARGAIDGQAQTSAHPIGTVTG